MGTRRVIVALFAAGLVVASGGYLYWRYVWFFRNPPRAVPAEHGLVSPADGTVVYVRKVEPGEDVVVIKRGLRATVKDIAREDDGGVKIVIGIFMSPFDVHYNRAPLTATIDFVRRHAGTGKNAYMGPMHWRTIFRRAPYYRNSVHIVHNERAVTRFVGDYRGEVLAFYVVQIGARTVDGIDTYYEPGERVERGATFGMIRIGSQVDLIVPWRKGLQARVEPGASVRAGESILVQ